MPPPLSLLLLVLLLILQFTLSKEFVATDEWQVLPPEDTVPTGLHVRLDMTTGERFAKIASADDEELTSENVDKWEAMKKAGQIAILRSDTDKDKDTDTDNNTTDNNTAFSPPPPKYDFEMMHRVFERIPPDIRPPLPNVTNIGRTQWEIEMTTIWQDRQAFIEDSMKQLVDAPRLLESFVTVLRDNAVTHYNNNETVVQTLFEVEELLYDVDMARDFHLFGGFTELVKILDDAECEEQLKITAAHTLGNMVKNHDEFHLWPLEIINEKNENGCAIDSVSRILLAKESGTNLKIKAVYCLSAFLRGNEKARGYFFAKKTLNLSELTNGANLDFKFLSKLLSLTTDLTSEWEMGEDEMQMVTGQVWCDTALKLIGGSDSAQIQEVALRSLGVNVPTFCLANVVQKNKAKLVLKSAIAKWKRLAEEGMIDEEYVAELVGLSERVIGN
ncbi:hypothetical protein ScalyP_jg2434 [Parmales sp. scaly parma]|nr:hypothetical protein ScalyP_jg2434 [Parmales sp. scaly parma]